MVGRTRRVQGRLTDLFAAVMNLTEMESMVREATNADPWGAPSKPLETADNKDEVDQVQAL